MSNSALKAWFKRPDTPSEHSPVGEMIVRILPKYPNWTFEQARKEANRLLDEAARRKHFQLPPVYTPEERETRQKEMRERFQNRPKGPLRTQGDTRSSESEEL